MIRLRAIRSTDKDQLRQWRNLPEVARYMYTDHHITREEHEQWFQQALSDPNRRCWIIVCDEIDVGVVNLYGIDDQNRRCYWAFYVADPAARGKGVGSYVEYSIMRHVFDELGLNKLCCEVLAFNQIVTNMHKSFGFKQEGYYREHIMKAGKLMDVVALAMLRSEWEESRELMELRLRRKQLIP